MIDFGIYGFVALTGQQRAGMEKFLRRRNAEDIVIYPEYKTIEGILVYRVSALLPTAKGYKEFRKKYNGIFDHFYLGERSERDNRD